jgi:hypothetical protein
MSSKSSLGIHGRKNNAPKTWGWMVKLEGEQGALIGNLGVPDDPAALTLTGMGIF